MKNNSKKRNALSFGWSTEEEEKLKANINKYGYDWMRVCEGLNRSWQSCKSKWYTSSATISESNTNIVTDSKRITTRSSSAGRDRTYYNENNYEKDNSISSYQRRNNLPLSSPYFHVNDEIQINHEKNMVKCMSYIFFK